MIEFKNVAKVYEGRQVAVEDINLSFEDGEFICFIGTSGSGKTTLMRMINRMNEPTEGQILIDGKDVMSYDPVELRRRIGYVIQQIGLMPHMTIYENITLVPDLLGWDEERKKKIAEKLIKRVDLPKEYLKKYPGELSGGQQQRIGVIRALAADQDIILMDEPFGALDPITRESLQELIKNLQQEMNKTVVFVTHDMDEALKLADRIVILDHGNVIQFDTPENILRHPATEYVEELLGEDKMNEAKASYETVEKIMIDHPIHVREDDKALATVKKMRDTGLDTLFVTDRENNLTGVVGIFDLGRVAKTNPPLKEVMKQPAALDHETKIIDAVDAVVEWEYRNLPVIDDEGKLIGVVTRATLIDTVYNHLVGEEGAAETADLND